MVASSIGGAGGHGFVTNGGVNNNTVAAAANGGVKDSATILNNNNFGTNKNRQPEFGRSHADGIISKPTTKKTVIQVEIFSSLCLFVRPSVILEEM